MAAGKTAAKALAQVKVVTAKPGSHGVDRVMMCDMCISCVAPMMYRVPPATITHDDDDDDLLIPIISNQTEDEKAIIRDPKICLLGKKKVFCGNLFRFERVRVAPQEMFN
jgi:hypothetical protein